MSLRNEIGKLLRISECVLHDPKLSFKLLKRLPQVRRGFNYGRQWENRNRRDAGTGPRPPEPSAPADNPLKSLFESRQTGRGVWKWDHYFDIYHRHFSKLVGGAVNVLEVGVYSGGSLEMWRDYFGPKCLVYGVDIEERCRSYENEYTKIFIGDQADRGFWKAFREQVSNLDVVVDDGGHQTEQQIVTFEELLPCLRPGGIYLCEDVHGIHNGFAAYLQGFVNNLNSVMPYDSNEAISPSEVQAWIGSVHFYPYVTVVEKADLPVRRFIAPKHGTEWQPLRKAGRPV
jgi:hypothetical protein